MQILWNLTNVLTAYNIPCYIIIICDWILKSWSKLYTMTKHLFLTVYVCSTSWLLSTGRCTPGGLHAFQTELPYLLGPINPCPTAVHMEPFPTSVFKALPLPLSTSAYRGCKMLRPIKYTILSRPARTYYYHNLVLVANRPLNWHMYSFTTRHMILSLFSQSHCQSPVEY